MNGKEWSICDVQYLIDRHHQFTYQQIGIVLMRSAVAVEVMANRIGLHKVRRVRSEDRPFKSKKPVKRRFPPEVRVRFLGDWV